MTADKHADLSEPQERPRERIREVLGEDGVVQRVETYYDPCTNYAGTTFDLLEPNPPWSFCPADLHAVSMLDVSVPPKATRWLLGDPTSARLLAEIPLDVSLWDVATDQLEPGSHLDQLWHAIEAQHGVGWVTAGKLLARKRPDLVPVYDTVVKKHLDRPQRDASFWQDLAAALRDEDLVRLIEEIKETAEVDSRVSLLRVLDVAVWMRGRETQ